MTRTGALIVLGILVILAPFSGFPSSLLTWIFVVCGLLTSLIGASLRKAHLAPSAPTLSVESEQVAAPLETVPAHPSQIS